jgi:hypothetical protein
MLEGLYLTLMIGPLQNPMPASLPFMESLQSVQVNSGRDRTGFQLTFTLGKLTPLQQMLSTGLLDPMSTRVVIVATLRGMPSVLCDGVITQNQITPNNEPGGSTLNVTGEDLTVLMDLEEVRIPFPSMTDAAKLYAILGKYASYGIAPIVVPPNSDSARSTNEGYDVQTVSDLAYIRQMASEAGFTFYLEPGPLPRTSLAYFGPDIRIPIPQRALNVNMDWATNVESLNFSHNGLSKQTTVITIMDPITKRIALPIPLPSIDVFKPPLGARIVPPAKKRFTNDLANLSPEQTAKRAFGLLREGADSVTGSGSLDVMRYGQILHARELVGVRGAGYAYDGLYYVESVTHNIKRGEYKQNFSLARDGLVSPTPVVPS